MLSPLFILFSLFSPDCVISQFLSSSSLTLSSICSADALYCIFSSHSEFLNSRISVISLSLVRSLILIIYIFFDSLLNWLSEFSCSSLSFVKTAILNSFSARSQILCLWTQWRIVFFLRWHDFLTLHVPCKFSLLFAHSKQQTPPKSLLVSFYEVLCLMVLYYLGFLPLSGSTFCILHAPSCDWILKLLWLLWFLQLAGNLSCFPEGGGIAQVCGFSLAHFPSGLPVCQSSFSCCTQKHTQELAEKEGRCGFSVGGWECL